MTAEILELGVDDSQPQIVGDRGVNAISENERQLHRPDRHLLVVERGTLLARCSCWWNHTAPLDGKRIGAIGHYAASDAAAASILLARACSVLTEAGCATAVGPMDGNTWRRYRFIIDRGSVPTFFLEPDNPDEWPLQWSASGFSPLAQYISAANEDIGQQDPRTGAALSRLTSEGISIRSFDPARAEDELRRMFRLSLAAFKDNFLYSPLEEHEFLVQNQAVLPFAHPDLILLAERGAELAGFMFAIADVLQARRGLEVDTVILKTIAVDTAVAGIGVGCALMVLVQGAA
ncbi:MAG: N-acetyltransferase [Acidobacteriota bacterium]